MTKSGMSIRYLLAFGCLVTTFPASALAQRADNNAFQGFYLGAEVGAISSDALIIFDGVTDPAGRGRFGSGVFASYGQTVDRLLIGAEIFANLASNADPFTFDSAVTGFSELTLDWGRTFGINARAGYLIRSRILAFGIIGYGTSKYDYLIDGTLLDQITGGEQSGTFGAFRYGGGVEGAITNSFHLRLTYRTLSGNDLLTADFEPLPSNAGLTRFTLEPSESQFLFGVLWKF